MEALIIYLVVIIGAILLAAFLHWGYKRDMEICKKCNYHRLRCTCVKFGRYDASN